MGLTGRIKGMFLRSGHQTEEVVDDAHYVLYESVGKESTSNVTEQLIADYVYNLKTGYIELTRCRPVITEAGECHTIVWGYDGDECEMSVCIYVKDNDDMLRFKSSGKIEADDATRIFFDFFSNSIVPPLDDRWEKQQLIKSPDAPSPLVLYIDRTPFKRFDQEDVMAALQKVEHGDSESMMLYTGEDLDGYIGVCFNEDGYVVEIEGLCGGKLRVFRVTTPYGSHVIRWLNDYYNERKFPTLTDDWEEIKC